MRSYNLISLNVLIKDLKKELRQEVFDSTHKNKYNLDRWHSVNFSSPSGRSSG